MNLLDSFELTQHINEDTHQYVNTLGLVITTGLNADNILVSKLPILDHYCVFFNVNAILTQGRGINDPEVNFK